MNTINTNSRPWEGGRFSRPAPRGSRYAIGDVHGCCRTLRALVENLLHLGKDDTLFLLGDYIDRGPDSKGVLDYLLALQGEGYDLRPLMGNHEELCLNAARGDTIAASIWYGNGGYETLQSFEVERPEDIPQAYLHFLAALPRILIEPDYVMVHAGLDFSTADPLRQTAPEFLLWSRSAWVQPENIDGRSVVCGHTVMPLTAICESPGRQIIDLDNGCFDKGHMGYGNLVALDLDTRQLLVQRNCE